MGRIPNFSSTIFDPDSMPVLNNAASLGLLIYLFVIGLEVDTRMFTHNWRVAAAVGFAGMILPFGLGVAIAVGLYNEFSHEAAKPDMAFGTFALFIGTALSITAFPVLCRILSELQLLNTPVGITVLAAGIGNDVTGWVLLALSVALVNNASGLAALYVFLTAVAWVLFLVFAVRPVFIWILRRNGSIQNGPSPGIIALTLIMVLVSSWFTAAIGVHAIFGSHIRPSLAPLFCSFWFEDQRQSAQQRSYMGLRLRHYCNRLLWEDCWWTFRSESESSSLARKLRNWRAHELQGLGRAHCACESEALVMMVISNKSQNIGLQAGILSERTFTMFVVMALVSRAVLRGSLLRPLVS
jgi:hypothetical protein